jgi:hypothetical protein
MTAAATATEKPVATYRSIVICIPSLILTGRVLFEVVGLWIK